MASTPPRQLLYSPQTPLTPLHGARYDDTIATPLRHSARLRQKRAREIPRVSGRDTTDLTRTPSTPGSHSGQSAPNTPGQTPKRKFTRNSQILSPSSPDIGAHTTHSYASQSTHLRPPVSSMTSLSQNMLPTPVKTPKKKQLPKSTLTGRALFQEMGAADTMFSSPRKSRKNKRFNGFSLQNIEPSEDVPHGVQIFTDSRDQVPEPLTVDTENPFLDEGRRGASSKKTSGGAKRRKISNVRQKDQQVEDAIDQDEGMVYVFRGRKVYRRFDDNGEEEEEIDLDDLGLLEHAEDGVKAVKPLRTLTRKSIKPTRLFQNEAQKRARELEKEEEAATDLEDSQSDEATVIAAKHHQDTTAPSHSNTTVASKQAEAVASEAQTLTAQNGKKRSPFDGWRRLKRGAETAPAIHKHATRGRKRAASEEPEELTA